MREGPRARAVSIGRASCASSAWSLIAAAALSPWREWRENSCRASPTPRTSANPEAEGPSDGPTRPPLGLSLAEKL